MNDGWKSRRGPRLTEEISERRSHPRGPVAVGLDGGWIFKLVVYRDQYALCN